MCAEHVVELFEALEVDIKDSYVSTHADCDLACVHADGTAAEDNDVCLGCSGNAGKKDTLAAELLLEILGAFLDGETACDLAHGSETGK